MKKLIAMLVTVICTVPMIVAQESVSGVVVDKKGNPLPGVRIEVPGSSDWTVSDLDGTFTITPPFGSKKVQATYAGMNSRKVKLKDGMRIKMKEGNWWTRKPDEWNWLVEAVAVFPQEICEEGRVFNPAYGLMVGRVKKFGYYVKGVTNTFGGNSKEWNDQTSGFIDGQKSTYWSATGGGIVRLGCPIHFYVGVGYSDYRHLLKDMSGNWYDYSDNRINGWSVEYGLMLRMNRVMISLGSCRGYKTDHKRAWAGNFGIGYTF